MDELKFVGETEQAFATWRGASDEIAQTQRVDTQTDQEKSTYQQRFGYKMPAAIEKEIRRDLLAQERTRAEAAEAAALTAYESAQMVLTTVRTAHERLPNTYEPTMLQVAQQWILSGNVPGILKKFVAATDADPFVFATEEAVALGVAKLHGEGVSREDAETALQLKQAILAKQRARWPAWTAEAETRLKAVMTVSDDALLRLKRMRLIG